MKYTVTALVLLLSGCASDKEYAAYLAAHKDASVQASADQKPLFKLESYDNQPITGLKSLEVYLPQQMPAIQQARPNEWVGVVNTGLAITGTVLGIHAGGIAASRLADSVGRSSTAGYGHIQAPGAVTTTANTMSNSTGVQGSGSYDSTHAPTVVTQPSPLVVTQPPVQVVNQPAPVVVNQPPPTIVNPQPGQVCIIDATGVATCI